MTVRDLKELLEHADDDMLVFIPMGEKFDGFFYSPCEETSGLASMAIEEILDEEDIQELKLLNKPIPKPVPTDVVLLVPEFFLEDEDGYEEELLN